MGSSASIPSLYQSHCQLPHSLSESHSIIEDPDERVRKYGAPPIPLGRDYILWKCRYLYQDGKLMRKIRKDTNHLRLKILMDIPLYFLQKTIVIIYSPLLSMSDTLVKYVGYKLNFPIIYPLQYESSSHMYYQIFQKSLTSGCLYHNYPTTASEIDQFNKETWAYRKVVLVFEYDMMVSC
jgi:hypothetical protein